MALEGRNVLVTGTSRGIGRAARRRPAGLIGPLVLSVLGAAALAAVTPGGALAQTPPAPTPRTQNPSPMVEHTRAHDRIPEATLPGHRFSLDGPFANPVHVFVPAGVEPSASTSLLIHFHGATYIAEHAAATAGRPYIVAVVNLGAGSGVYERAFGDDAALDSLLAGVQRGARPRIDAGPAFGRLVVSAFSAGHGAVRALLRDQRHRDRVDGALLLDGIHTGYVPRGTVLDEGGQLDTTRLAPYAGLARSALRGERSMLVTHSDVFPGTFASTTETVTWLLDTLGLRRRAVLEWGPVGMQQLSEAGAGRLLVMGFAGNSAPDHVDHLHGMPELLRRLDNLGARPALMKR